MRRWIVAAVLLVISTAARADVGLAIICGTASAEGQMVSSGACQWGAQSYNVPTDSSLVRVDPQATLGGTAVWARTSFVWKRWGQVLPGELYEVCTADMTRGTPVVQGNCGSWAFAAKAGATRRRVEVSWLNATQHTDCTPIPAWDSGLPGRLIATHVQRGTLNGSTFTSAGEVRVPMPETATAFDDVLVGDDFAVRAQHMTIEGNLTDWTTARLGEVVSPPPCIAPEPPPPEPILSAVPNVAGANVSVAWGITATGRRSSTVKALVPIGAACEGERVFGYRGQDYYRFDTTQAGWWASTPTTAVAVACE